MVAAPGTLLNAGKRGACRSCHTSAIHVPFQSIWLARRKGLQLLSSFLYYFSLSYLDRPSMGAEVGRLERFVFLFLALFCQAFVSVFFVDSNVLELVDSC